MSDTWTEKKGHICPPSNAIHPADRWESVFVYAFICKFTQLRGKVDGLDSPMDFEDALLAMEANPVMTQILARFVLNLRPQTRNLSSDVISSTLATLLQEFMKTNERTVFWNEGMRGNLSPFDDMDCDFWGAGWGIKLDILRQLVELQLCHSTEVKSSIDRAWGVIHNKHKKAETTPARPPPSDPNSQENLQLVPVGQDCERKRYWIVDDSPRVYTSTNPWKITATFQCVSSTLDEYVALFKKLKESAPPEPKAGSKRTKLEAGHAALVKMLEGRLPTIEAELARIQRARKKIAQRNMLIAQAEVRETRTRRQTTRPDYAYLNDPDEDDQDEYKYQEDEEEEDHLGDDDFQSDGPSTSRRVTTEGRRRSSRAKKPNGSVPRTMDEWGEWRGERRSARLGAPSDNQLDGPPPKRARTVESTASSVDVVSPIVPSGGNGIKLKMNGAAAIKPTETVVEAVAGKKKSKFWVYAVEPIQSSAGIGPTAPAELDQNGGTSAVDQYRNGATDIDRPWAEVRQNGTNGHGIEGSLSPTSSMDES